MNRPITVIFAVAALAWGCARGPGPEPPAPPPATVPFGCRSRSAAGAWVRSGRRPFSNRRGSRELFPERPSRTRRSASLPDETMAVITVEQDGRTAAGDRRRHAQRAGHRRSADRQGPRGRRAGARAGRRAAEHQLEGGAFDLSQCEIGAEHDVNRVICARPGDGLVTYVFAVPGWDFRGASAGLAVARQGLSEPDRLDPAAAGRR